VRQLTADSVLQRQPIITIAGLLPSVLLLIFYPLYSVSKVPGSFKGEADLPTYCPPPIPPVPYTFVNLDKNEKVRHREVHACMCAGQEPRAR
jgi:hypothetical protein